MDQIEEKYIDLKRILDTIIEKWYYFITSLAFCLLLAVLYLKTAADTYELQATLQLNDQSLSDRGKGAEQFISGLELLSGNSELEDEIGVLSSRTMVERTLRQLHLNVSYFQYPSTWGPIDRWMEEEVYQTGLRIIPNEEQLQVIGVPIYLSFPDAQHYRVQAETDEATLFNLSSQAVVQEEVNVAIDDTLALDEAYHSSLLNFSLALDTGFIVQEDQRYYFIVHSYAQLAKSYAKRLNISPISDESNIVSLTLEERVPQKGKDFLNTLTEVYIQHDLQKKNQLGVRTIEFIDEQLSSVYDSLQSVEGNLKSFRASDQVIDISTTSESLNQQLQILEAEQAELKVKQEYYQYTARYLGDNEAVTDVVAPSSVGIEDPFLTNLLNDLAELSREKAAKGANANPNNPLVRVLNEKIRNTKAALLENINNLINSNRIAIRENQRRIQRLESRLNRLPESERNLINIERKFALNDNIYNYLLEKRAEAGIALASNLPNKSVVDYARLSSDGRISPSTLPILAAALLLGLAMPLGLLWVQYLFNERVTEPESIREVNAVPTMGVIPQSPKKHRLPVIELPASPIAEAFRFLRLELNKIDLDDIRGAKVIGVTSAQQGDGKTFCSSNLAAAYARSGARTLLMGADLRNPRLYEYFNVSEFGLAECLENGGTIERMTQKTPLNNLRIMSAGKANVDIGILIESDALARLMQQLREQFDVIVVDTPPLSIVADYYVLARYFDINVFVVRQHQTSATIVKGALTKFSKFPHTALILNEARNALIKDYGYQHSNNGYYTNVKTS